jgi:GTPase SAR1 family protein
MSFDYRKLKDELLSCIDDMLGIENIPGCPCEELREKVSNNVFNLVILGQFKRGKTTLINALLGAEILPTGVVPLTSIPTIIQYGKAFRTKVLFEDGRVKEIRHENLHLYVTEKGNPKNEKQVSEVIITYPSEYLKDGVRLIDTPGVGSVYQHNTDVAYMYLPKSDAAVFMLSVDQPVSQSEIEFLRDVREYSDRIFFLLNKIDYVRNSDDLDESINFTKATLKECMDSDIRLFPASARLGLDGKLSGSRETIEESALSPFEDALNRFLMEEKARVLIQSVSNTLNRHLSQALLELELEMKSLSTPVEELNEKIRLFEKKKNEVMKQKREFDMLLDGEVNNIIKETIDTDLEKFKKELTERLVPEIERLFNENKSLSARKLNKLLEGFIIDEVKNAYNNWRGREDGKIASLFEQVCDRFMERINDIASEILRFSSKLFSIRLEIGSIAEVWSRESGFYYKFKDEPVSLELLRSSVIFALPGFISNRVIAKKIKEFLHEMIDKQGGRVRFDFTERLQKSKLDFRWKMLQRIEATIEGISSAINKGMNEKAKGEIAIKQRRNSCLETIGHINQLRERIADILI